MDAGPDRREQTRQRYPPARRPLATGRLRRRDADDRADCSSTGPTPSARSRLFFCQIEALETAIYLTEVAEKYGDAWIENDLRRPTRSANPRLPRSPSRWRPAAARRSSWPCSSPGRRSTSCANPQDARFSDTFLIVTPGITIRDRLRVLLPNDPDNYYRQRDLVPADLLERARHRPRSSSPTSTPSSSARQGDAGKLTKTILDRRQARRVHRDARTRWSAASAASSAPRRTSSSSTTRPTTATAASRRRRGEADRRRAQGGREARGGGPRSGSPAWRPSRRRSASRRSTTCRPRRSSSRGSGYPEGTLFPWVVSDFSLIDAIESGIVKVPRVPVADDAMTGDQPTYRDLWLRIRDDLPKKGRGTDAVARRAEAARRAGRRAAEPLRQLREAVPRCGRPNAEAPGQRPHAAGLHRRLQQHQRLQAGLRLHRRLGNGRLPDGSTVVVPGKLPLFSNVDGDGAGCTGPNTILVDSEQLESGEAMSAEFKKIAAREIEEFKAEYRARFPGRDAEDLTDEDLLREVMNTVGKPGKLGEHVTCVVSVSMLTEGWDANTVTHILGVRAFGTQLLCEQVVGRGLRRMSYAAERRRASSTRNTPRSTACRSRSSRARASTKDPKPGPIPTRVRALADRDRLRDHLPPPARLSLRAARRAADGRRSTDESQARPHHGRHPDEDRERPDRRRDAASTPSTT